MDYNRSYLPFKVEDIRFIFYENINYFSIPIII